MTQDIREYVASCQLCLRNKNKTHKPYGKLDPLPVPEGRWTRVALDFITDLPKTRNGNTAILTCIDEATKRGRFIACKLTGLSAEKAANLFRQNVIRQHGIPRLVITDRGKQFVNKFWTQLGSTLGFKQIPTTTAHQQGNGLAERINQPIEAYLRSYVNFEQNNWDEYLDLFEFCWNNSKHATTGMTSFYADQGYNPNFQIKREEPGEAITSQSAAIHASNLKKILTKLKEIMEVKNHHMGIYYDKKHEDAQFAVGDWVMLKTNHIRTPRTCKKLSEKQIGPFKIIKKVTGQTYQLDLKNLVGKIHDVFHVEKLEKSKKLQKGQADYGMQWIVNDEENLKSLKDIINSRENNNNFEYQLLWSDNRKEWVALDEFDTNDVEINAFHNRYPNKPVPNYRILNRNTRTRKPPIRFIEN